jgi:hypothetical protein
VDVLRPLLPGAGGGFAEGLGEARVLPRGWAMSMGQGAGYGGIYDAGEGDELGGAEGGV